MKSEFYSFIQHADVTLFHALNNICGHYAILDHLANRIDSVQLKGLAFIGTFGVLWFQQTATPVRQRKTLVLVLVSVIVSILCARLLAELLPFRTRPMFATWYNAPLFHRDIDYENWSSFPSDNATLLFALTTGFWLISRWWGLAWACFSVPAMVARVYLGVHYPSDVIAGALLGVAVTLAINNRFMRAHIASPILAAEKRAPAAFYGLLFPFIYEISTLFAFTRSMLAAMTHMSSGVAG